MSIGKIIALIFGIFFLFLGITFTIAGVAVLAVSNVYTDSEGYFTSPDYQLTKENAVAVVFSDININVKSSSPGYVQPDLSNIVKIRMALSSTDNYFIGVAPSDKVDSYLASVPYAKITDFNWNTGLQVSDIINPTATGNLSSNTPANQTFWDATGSQSQVLNWVPKQGQWTFVVMKANGTTGVDVAIKAGAKVPILGAIGTFLMIFGILFIVLAIVMFIIIGRSNKTKIVTVPQYAVPGTRARVSEIPSQAYMPPHAPVYGYPSPKVSAEQQGQEPKPAPEGVNEEVYAVADWGPRILAYIIDVIIVSIVVETFRFPFVIGTSTNQVLLYPAGLSINGIVLFVYFLLLETYYGTTIGKKVLKLEVITEDGRRPELKESAISALGKAFFLPIDLIIGLVMKDTEHEVPLNQRLMQKVSKTLVIVQPEKPVTYVPSNIK